MTSHNNKVAVTTLTGVIAVVLIVLGVSLRWPVWGTALAVLCGCAVVLVAVAVTQRKPAQQPPPITYVPPPRPQEPPQTVTVQGVNLASAWPDYEFTFGVTVYWRPVDGSVAPEHFRPGAIAVDMIIRRAAEVAAREEPQMAVRLQHRLNDVLGQVERDSSGRIVAWADQVWTILSDKDRERLQSLADIRKDKALWEHQRSYESDKREYLTDDVLRSTGSAVVWWLSRNETDVDGAVELIGTMARLSAAAKNEDVPELFRHLLPSFAQRTSEPGQPGFATIGSDGSSLGFAANGNRSVTDLVNGLMHIVHMGDDERALFADRLAMDLASMGHQGVAQEIRERFDVITEQFTDPPEPEQDPVGAPGPERDSWPAQDALSPDD